MKLTEKPIGQFRVTSNEILVSDPCYDASDLNHLIKGVRKGKWDAKIYLNEEGRVMYLMAWNIVIEPPVVDSYKWHLSSDNIGVDSGQVGIYDKEYYQDDAIVEGLDRIRKEPICPDEPWYSFNCDRTTDKMKAGIIPFGCVSSSGYGEGVYSCWTYKTNRKIHGIAVNFR